MKNYISTIIILFALTNANAYAGDYDDYDDYDDYEYTPDFNTQFNNTMNNLQNQIRSQIRRDRQNQFRNSGSGTSGYCQGKGYIRGVCETTP